VVVQLHLAFGTTSVILNKSEVHHIDYSAAAAAAAAAAISR
jgi:hypothetical protein